MKILLIDDERDFLDGRDYTVIRSSKEAIEHFSNPVSYDEVWLDYSLLRGDTIFDFLVFARDRSAQGKPLDVGEFVAHTSSSDGVMLIKEVLSDAGYQVRSFNIAFQSPEILS